MIIYNAKKEKIDINEKNYVNIALENMKRIKSMKNEKTKKPIKMVTTSQLRNILSKVMDIYNQIQVLSDDNLDDNICGQIEYLKVHTIYSAYREINKELKVFVQETYIIELLNEINGSRKNFILFAHYMEALVAFHKFYGGKE